MEKRKILDDEITINKSKDRVWKVLFAQFSEISRFHPFLTASHLLSEVDGQIGAIRQCDFPDGSSIKEKIAAVRENISFDIEITEGPEVYKNLLITFNVSTVNNTQTKVISTVNQVGNSEALSSEMVERITQTFRDVLIALKYHLETGVVVNTENFELFRMRMSV